MTQESGARYGVVPVEDLPVLPSDETLLQTARELPPIVEDNLKVKACS